MTRPENEIKRVIENGSDIMICLFEVQGRR